MTKDFTFITITINEYRYRGGCDKFLGLEPAADHDNLVTVVCAWSVPPAASSFQIGAAGMPRSQSFVFYGKKKTQPGALQHFYPGDARR